MNKADLAQRAAAVRWFHQIDLGDGVMTEGAMPITSLRAVADIVLGQSVAGKTVLDVGCWDGFYSFEAHRRGAARVLATDHFVWHNEYPGSWGNRAAFELARSVLAPPVEVMDINLMDLSPERVGKWDVVLFLGVLYHLRHPLLVLERISSLVRDTLVLETAMDAADIGRPAMVFYPGAELNGDATNWWGPNRACVEAMLRTVGFSDIRFTNHIMPARGIFHARR
jgi:tRNA (mo5U34)-methyltransferase